MEWIFSGISCNYGRSHKYVYTHTFVLGKVFYAEGKVSRVMHDAYFQKMNDVIFLCNGKQKHNSYFPRKLNAIHQDIIQVKDG